MSVRQSPGSCRSASLLLAGESGEREGAPVGAELLPGLHEARHLGAGGLSSRVPSPSAEPTPELPPRPGRAWRRGNPRGVVGDGKHTGTHNAGAGDFLRARDCYHSVSRRTPYSLPAPGLQSEGGAAARALCLATPGVALARRRLDPPHGHVREALHPPHLGRAPGSPPPWSPPRRALEGASRSPPPARRRGRRQSSEARPTPMYSVRGERRAWQLVRLCKSIAPVSSRRALHTMGKPSPPDKVKSPEFLDPVLLTNSM